MSQDWPPRASALDWPDTRAAMEETLTSSICPTCGHARPDEYCPRCGERRVRPDEYTVRRFLRHFVGDESIVQTRTGRTLVTLFRRPGQLTHDYLRGRRNPYLSPLRVYLLISVLFFLIVPYTGLFRYNLQGYHWMPIVGTLPQRMVGAELERTGQSFENYQRRFNEELASQRKTMMVFVVPLFALGLIPLFRRRHYGEHLVFATHYFAALLLYMGVPIQIFFRLFFAGLRELAKTQPAAANAIANLLQGEVPLTILIILPGIWYLRTAALRAYQVSSVRATTAAVALAVWQFVLIGWVYRPSMFFTTYYALKYFG